MLYRHVWEIFSQEVHFEHMPIQSGKLQHRQACFDADETEVARVVAGKNANHNGVTDNGGDDDAGVLMRPFSWPRLRIMQHTASTVGAKQSKEQITTQRSPKLHRRCKRRDNMFLLFRSLGHLGNHLL